MCVLPSSSKKRKNGNFAVSEISTISLISRNISGYGGGRVPPLCFAASANTFIALYNSSFAGYSNATFLSTSTTRCNNGKPGCFLRVFVFALSYSVTGQTPV